MQIQAEVRLSTRLNTLRDMTSKRSIPTFEHTRSLSGSIWLSLVAQEATYVLCQNVSICEEEH